MDRRSFFALQSDSTSARHTTRGHRGRLLWGSYLHEKIKATPRWHLRAYDAQTDKYSVLFQNGRTVEWELDQVCKMWGKGKNQQQWLMNLALRYGGNRTHTGASSGLIRSRTLTTRPTMYIRLVPYVPITCDGNIRYQSYIHSWPSG